MRGGFFLGWMHEVAKGIRGRVFGMTFVQSLN